MQHGDIHAHMLHLIKELKQRIEDLRRQIKYNAEVNKKGNNKGKDGPFLVDAYVEFIRHL